MYSAVDLLFKDLEERETVCTSWLVLKPLFGDGCYILYLQVSSSDPNFQLSDFWGEEKGRK